MFKIIKENTIIISGILVFLAVVKQMLFYNEFHISVIDYLTFGEIMTSIFDDIYFFIWITTLILLYSIFTNITLELPKLFYKKYDSIRLKENFLNIDIDIKFFTLLSISILFFCSLRFDFFKVNNFMIFFLILSILQTILIFFEFMNRNDEIQYKTQNKDKVFSIVISFLVYVIISAHNDAIKIKSNNSYTNIITNSDTIKCSKQNAQLFIGKSENFCFIYNSKKKSTIALKMTDVKSIEQSEK